ncbi:MAG: M4 family metallopeptidase [Acidimicrobiales bacterium]
MTPRHPLHCIVPPDLLGKIVRTGSEEDREAALHTMEIDQTFRLTRAETAASLAPAGLRASTVGGTPGTPHRTIYDQHHSDAMALGTVVRSEGQAAGSDAAVNEAYDGFGATYGFYWDVFHRDSIDDSGLPILGLVHFSTRYDNAFWDGQGHMFFGDGDGRVFIRLTKSIDVIGHELTHGVTQYTANLAYSSQSGALNESVSDVFGSLVKQYHNHQDAASADWLIGNDIVGPLLKPALRSLKAPGTANAHDDQPADMDHFVHTSQDNGGVHTNSGIPNHAFYVVATTIGGNAWETAGKIWYESLRDPRLRPNTTFSSFAKVTVRQARSLFGTTSVETDAVKAGWDAVKVKH